MPTGMRGDMPTPMSFIGSNNRKLQAVSTTLQTQYASSSLQQISTPLKIATASISHVAAAVNPS